MQRMQRLREAGARGAGKGQPEQRGLFAAEPGDPNANPLNSLPALFAEKSGGGVALGCDVDTGS
jgi:hypothetical protein